MKSLLPFSLLSVLIACAGWSSARATVLDPITGVTAPADLASSPAEGSSTYTVSDNTLQAGASNRLGASDSLGDSGFYSGNASDFGNFVTGNPGGYITYDLGAAYNVSDLLIWNFSQQGGDSNGTYNSAGVQEVQILTSTTGLPGTFSAIAGPNSDGTFTFNEVTENVGYNTGPGDASPSTFNIPAQVLSVDLPDAQYVELNLVNNWGWSGGLIGVAEVNFVGSAVPEPSTYAMLGLGLLGLIAWQRRRAVFKIQP
jgi:hypothetical protein